ncbi:putative phosphoesterase [Ralstonia phage RP31]|uniref:Putative phosphoesterase n=2 Tax=Ripduovirus RP12 TaxID=2560700 RepID=A0A1L7N0Y6_9CAUD|nr:DHH phosphoesterase [Ralstonia phage RP12]BAW19142.1 putative phosphoesterase [Ralstonia phage RP12]BAW19428.1 putative phosphoesterase [Ralstonia phage RP31]
MTIYVLHHADSDGRFAAYAAWRHFKDNIGIDVSTIQFREVQYKQPFPYDIDSFTKEDQVYILDFSYDRQTLDKVYEKVGLLKVLDHHATAEEQLKAAPYAFFDKTKSGALLAWEYFFPDSSAPLACLLVDDFDMWAWKYPDTGAFESWLHFDRVRQNWAKWDLLCTVPEAMEHAIKTGKTIEQYNESVMHSITSVGSNMGFGDFVEWVDNPCNVTKEQVGLPPDDVPSQPVAEGSWTPPKTKVKIARYAVHNGLGIIHSQLGGFICKKFEVDVSIGFRVKRNVVVFNVRSTDEEKGFAKQVAERFGGGGHKCAASFIMPLSEGLEMIQALFERRWI